jgi:hypothetical protein
MVAAGRIRKAGMELIPEIPAVLRHLMNLISKFFSTLLASHAGEIPEVEHFW